MAPRLPSPQPSATAGPAAPAGAIPHRPGLKWSRERVLETLQTMHAQGDNLNLTHLHENHGGLRAAAIRYFGTMDEALVQVGADPAVFRRRSLSWNKTRIVEVLQQLARDGQDLSRSRLCRSHSFLVMAISHHFPSYDAALQAAGFDPQQIRQRKRWDAAGVLAAIQQLKKSGQDLSRLQMKRAHHGGLLGAATRYFGHYDQALRAAGIDPATVRRNAVPWTTPGLVEELKALQRRGEDLCRSQMQKRRGGFLRSVLRHFGSYEAALQAAGIDPDRVRRKARSWDRPAILRALKQFHRRGQDLSTSRMVRSGQHSLVSASWRLFGSYENALRAAGIDPDQVRRRRRRSAGTTTLKWDKPRIVATLRELKKRGEDLSLSRMMRDRGGFLGAAIRRFGSYAQALRAAGLDYGKIRRTRVWDRRRILEILVRDHRRGWNIGLTAMTRRHPGLLPAAQQRFGTYAKAVAAAGINYENIRGFTRWTPAKLLAGLRALKRKGQDFRFTVMVRQHGPLTHSCVKHFGSFAVAMKAAGIPYTGLRRHSKEQILSVIQTEDHAGKDIRLSAMAQRHNYVISAATRHFGSYRKAVESLGLAYPPKAPLKFWTRPKVLKTLARLYDEGVDLRYATFKQTHQPLFAAARYYYGQYHRAVTAAGIGYAAMVATMLQREAPQRPGRAAGVRA